MGRSQPEKMQMFFFTNNSPRVTNNSCPLFTYPCVQCTAVDLGNLELLGKLGVSEKVEHLGEIEFENILSCFLGDQIESCKK